MKIKSSSLPKAIFLSLLLLLTLLNTGCWDRRELESLAFVLTLGIDQSAIDNQYDFTFRIAVPGNLDPRGGKGTSAEEMPDTSKVVTVTARSLPEAISLLRTSIERSLDFRHLRVVIFGEELAYKEGLLFHIDHLERDPHFRRTIYVWINKFGTARDVFLINMPVLEAFVTRYIEGTNESIRETGYARPIILHDLVAETEEHHVDTVIPLICINPIIEEEKKDGKIVPMPTEKYRESVKDIIGGEQMEHINRSGGNPLEIIGLAVIQEGKMIEQISGWESRVYSLLRDSYRYGTWTFEDPEVENKTFAVELYRSRPPRVEIDWQKEDPVTIDITFFLEGNVRDIQSLEKYISPETYPLLEGVVTKVIAEQTIELISKMQELETDPFYLARFIRTQMLYKQEYIALDWKKRFAQAEVNVTVDFNLRRPGLVIQPMVIPEQE
ncbi:Ger(x)C family spore germination protein [Heliorestis acidaminivorans]|uniref:Ger(X)C family spore germination protein n=1 Tax=Heliorestis acidaminivorans TaxID=553427 RepID=A0A6I0ETG6_9FIRM|nr:Ger(x)C family spore germination protein [Heliorestis acidaminivorans]KAB2953369.1 Ger(x)C family spore germination protein [Heliorestis acidaminivorans]